MSKFIEVTVDLADQQKAIIDCDNIYAIRQTPEGLCIYFIQGSLSYLIVDESYEEMKRILLDGTIE